MNHPGNNPQFCIIIFESQLIPTYQIIQSVLDLNKSLVDHSIVIVNIYFGDWINSKQLGIVDICIFILLVRPTTWIVTDFIFVMRWISFCKRYAKAYFWMGITIVEFTLHIRVDIFTTIKVSHF